MVLIFICILATIIRETYKSSKEIVHDYINELPVIEGVVLDIQNTPVVHINTLEKKEMADVPGMYHTIRGKTNFTTYDDTKVLGMRNWRNLSEEFYRLAPEVRR